MPDNAGSAGFPPNLPSELREDWARVKFLYNLAAEPMDLERTEIERGDPVLMIGTRAHTEPVLCQFLNYIHAGEDAYFITPFKLILKKPEDKNGVLVANTELQTPKTHKEYSRIMPTRGQTVVNGMDWIEDTLYRMKDYDFYAESISQTFEKLKSS